MAKVQSPILSIGAQGQIGKSQVYARWRGVPYARQLVVPSNPRSTAQQLTRGVFSGLSQLWKRAGTIAREPFNVSISGRPLTARNQYTKSNLSTLRGQTDFAGYVGSPGARGGIPPTSLAAVAGVSSGEIDLTVGAPSEPTGWTLDAIQWTAFQDHDPEMLPTDFIQEGEDTSPTAGSDVAITISGLDAGTDYVVSAWTQWTRPDGRTAYGASLSAIQASAA